MLLKSRIIRVAITPTFFLASLLAASTTVAQEKPADKPHDMEHMQHSSEHGGFMQGGMHHSIARGVKLEDVEAALAQRTGMSGLEEKASRKL